MLTQAPPSDKEALFHLVYNCSLYVYDYCRVLRKSIYGILCIRYLKQILISMESSITLLKSKYLEWRVKVYIGTPLFSPELIRIYEENGSVQSALELSIKAADTIRKQKELEELDPPVPEYSKKIYQRCQHYLNTFVLKFQIQVRALLTQLGELKVDQVKNKLKEPIMGAEDQRDRLLTVMEILAVNNKSYDILQHDGKKEPWRDAVVDFAYETVKDDLEFMAAYLEKKFNDLKDKAFFKEQVNSSSFLLTENPRPRRAR
jgi:hypothetical protein